MVMRTIMAKLDEFERDLIRERVKSGLAAARRPWRSAGPSSGDRPSDRKAKRVVALHRDGLSYLPQKMEIVRRNANGNANQHGGFNGPPTS